MEKSFQLEPREMQNLQALETERKEVLAQIGALSLDMEAAKKKLAGSMEAQKHFLRNALSNRGLDNFQTAKLVGNEIIVTLSEDMPNLTQQLNQELKTNGLAE